MAVGGTGVAVAGTAVAVLVGSATVGVTVTVVVAVTVGVAVCSGVDVASGVTASGETSLIVAEDCGVGVAVRLVTVGLIAART